MVLKIRAGIFPALYLYMEGDLMASSISALRSMQNTVKNCIVNRIKIETEKEFTIAVMLQL